MGPLARWKRFPMAAAACIFVVRGLIVQIGIHEHARAAAVPTWSLPAWYACPTNVFAICFFTLFGVSIALFKDIPDIVGDKAAGVHTAAVVHGAQRVKDLVMVLLSGTYGVSGLYWLSQHRVTLAVIHVLVGVHVYRNVSQTTLNLEDIRKTYMYIWGYFYLEYLILFLTLVV